MTKAQNKVERARGAMRSDVWTELQHRRVAKRLDEALSGAPRRSRRWLAGVVGGMAAVGIKSDRLSRNESRASRTELSFAMAHVEAAARPRCMGVRAAVCDTLLFWAST